MAPLLFSYGQSIIDEVYKQRLVEEYIKEHGQPSGDSTEAPVIHAEDDAEVALDTEVTDSSSEISLDQSNNGFSLVNLHWASFSTGLSSVLAVVLVGLIIRSLCMLSHRQPATSVPQFTSNLVPIRGPPLALPHPSTLGQSTTPSPVFQLHPPPLVVSRVVPPHMNALLQSSSTPPAQPASCPSPMTLFKAISHVDTRPSITAMNRVLARPVSIPSLDKGSVPTYGLVCSFCSVGTFRSRTLP